MVTLLNQGPYGQALFGLGMEGKRAAGYDPLNSVSPAVTAAHDRPSRGHKALPGARPSPWPWPLRASLSTPAC